MMDDDLEGFEGDSDEELEREAILGFKPQKEIIYNKLLPYSNELDDESQRWFQEIKTNLAKAIVIREIRPGVITWISRLNKYIRHYSLKFTKADHISLIKILYELITIPDLEPWLVNKAAALLVTLLRRKELIQPDELTVDWKSLYQLYDRLMYSHFEPLAMVHYPPSLENTLRMLNRCSRPYFQETATQEMLDEWRPWMCPFDVTMGKAMSYFEMFLPTFNVQHRKESTYLLWFDEFFGFWSACHNSPPWEGNLFSLYSRLADHNIGMIDWEPYIPKFFTRFQKNFNLPVMYKGTNVGNKSVMLDIATIVKWISAVFGNNSSCQFYLHKICQAVESYYVPANLGRHSARLNEFQTRLCQFFIKRLHRERHSKPKWGQEIPEDKRLTDADVTAFVDIIKPIALLSMYSKYAYIDAGAVLQMLATLRPEVIIPPLIERLYAAMDTLTEPHKLTACLHAVVSVSRSLVYPGPKYPEGPTHVIPLLMAVLPGIDPNDTRKSMVTFQFISTFCTLIPLVDTSRASDYYPDLTPEEREVCAQSAEFEDFVVQFLDRCFALIETSSLEQTRQETSSSDHRNNREENMKDIGMASTFAAILTQSSPSVYDAALRKLQNFVNGRILEPKIAGKITASLCRCATKVNPAKGLKAFLPIACRTIKSLISDELKSEEQVDDELKFNLLILSECVRVPGQNLFPYISDVEDILVHTLHLANKDAYTISGAILRHTLRSLTSVCATEYKSIPEGYSRPLEDYLPIRDWGKPGNIHDLKLTWHIPSAEELEIAQRIVDRNLSAQLSELAAFASGSTTLTRDELKNRLNIVIDILLGCGSVLPQWSDEDPLHLVDSEVHRSPFKLVTSPKENKKDITLKGLNLRREVATVMNDLQTKLLTESEDDTKSLIAVVTVYQMVLFYGGIPKEDFDSRWKSFNVVKKAMENKLIGNRRHIRALLIDRAQLQHEGRLLENTNTAFTKSHEKVFQNLLTLATSHYSNVRIKAQDVLSKGTAHFTSSYRVLVPTLVDLLREDPNISHEQFKGALYVIAGSKHRSMLVKHNWEIMTTLWPSLIAAQHSEKPSIVALLDYAFAQVHRYIDTFSITLDIPASVIDRTRDFWTANSSVELPPYPTDDVIEQGRVKLESVNKTNSEAYEQLIGKLCELLQSGSLHWRHYNMAIGMIGLLIRHDVALPLPAVRIIVNNLIHENLAVRKSSIHILGCILKQQKRPHAKVPLEVDYPEGRVTPGDRPDNEFMCYNSERVPKTAEEWDRPRFVHKTHYGYYYWPKNMTTYAPSSQQPKLDRTPEEMNETEKFIFEFFNSESNINELIRFLSLEENKGRDKFDARRFTMFKGLFRNYGASFLHLFRPHIERLVTETQESSQRCAAEIIASLIRGAKHWPFDMTCSMWEWLVPVVRSVLDKVSTETIGDWGTCFATASESRDPGRIHWMLEVLMEEPLRSQGSFIDSSRLYVLQGALAQQEWRVGELLHRLLAFLRPYLTHPFQNVRERLGSVLTNVFLCDLDFDGKRTSNQRNPCIADLIEEILPGLEMMAKGVEEPQKAENNHVTPEDGAKQSPPRPMLPPEMAAMLGGLRGPPPPEVAAMMGGAPPELLASMLGGLRGPPPPQLAAMLGGLRMPPPPEMLAALRGQAPMIRPPPPGAMMRPPFVPPPNFDIRAMLSNGIRPEILNSIPPELLSMGTGPKEPEIILGMSPEEYEKRQVGVRLLQTACKFMCGSLMRAFNAAKPEYYKLLLMFCINESSEFETNLARDCTITLACLAQIILPDDLVPGCLQAIDAVAKSASWKARAAVLDFLQVMIFNNLPLILSRNDWVDEIIRIIEFALEDERVEVRVKASEVLSGVLHCEFGGKQKDEKLLASFYAKARTKLRKRKKQSSAQNGSTDSETAAAILRRHSGILGLCAFINAYPYDVPEFMPDVLMCLSEHLHDPQPIPVTIKKTLQDFKRTHQDNWQDHKLKFSDDQITALTDLLVSPSYYA